MYNVVFGRNPRVPDISSAVDVSQLKERSPSKIVSDTINSLQTARREYLAAESNSRLKRALKGKVENSSCKNYVTGDQVIFRRSIDDEWGGPGKVVGQLGTVVIVLFGGNLIKLHFTKVKLRSQALEELNSTGSKDTKQLKTVKEVTGKGPITRSSVERGTGQRPVGLPGRGDKEPEKQSSDSDTESEVEIVPETVSVTVTRPSVEISEGQS